MPNLLRRQLVWLQVGLLLPMLAGCLPFGGPSEPEELFPDDSLSRDIAQSRPVIELELVNRIAPDQAAYFGSMQLGPDSLIWIGDLSSHSIRRFDPSGKEQEPVTSSGLQYPYMAGTSGDTSFAYDVGSERLYQVDATRITGHLDLPARAGGPQLSRFVSVLNGYVYVKDAGVGEHATLAVLKPGETPIRVELPGSSWKYHGIVTAWADRMVGTSSFRPMIYLFDQSARVDSMALRGFDSPMLARSRSFALGDVSDPPLMVSSVTPFEDRLYVLNVRPGILRIDEYDETGLLQRVFQRESPQPDAFTPMDLVVLRLDDTARAPDESGLTFYVISTLAEYEAVSLDYRSRLDILEPRSAQ